MRKLIGAVVGALDLALRDPGSRGIRLRTGRVVTSPGQHVTQNIGDLIAATLAPERFVALGEAEVPADGVREVNRFVEERWTAVPRPLRGSIAELAAQVSNGVVPLAGHKVTQHVRSRRGFAHLHGEELRQHLLSIGVQTQDDATYCGYYPTIRGNDVAHHDPTQTGMRAHQGGEALRGRPLIRDGKVVHDGTIRGGTEIRGGRAELRRVMKERGYEPWDLGHQAHVDRIRAESQQKRQAAHDLAVEKRDSLLPRKVGEV